MTKTKGKTIWLIGLPCSGKTTLGDALKTKYLPNAVRLDGDYVRQGICAGLGFTEEGRFENLRRCSEISQLLNEQGFDVICSFITPLYVHHKLIRSIVTDITLVYVSTDAETCEKRDVKGMWEKARQGKLRGFTGYDSCFEEPFISDLKIDTKNKTIDECVDEIFSIL